MKTTRINLPNNAKEQQRIDNYLTDIYNKKGRFTNLQEVYEESRKTEESESYKNPVVKEAVISSYPDSTWGFFLYLSIGVKEAAFYLAMSFIDELGAEQNDDLAELSMAIGIKLGDKKSKDLAGKNKAGKDETFDNIKDLTNQCVKQISKNAKEIGKKEITYEKAIGMAKVLDNIVKAKIGSSFEDNILPGSIKGYAKFVAVEGMDEYGASSSAHNASYETCPDTSFESFEDQGDVAMGGESSHYYPHHH